MSAPAQVDRAPWRKGVVVVVAILALLGMVDAFANLPVVSGCVQHAPCPAVPGAAGAAPEEP